MNKVLLLGRMGEAPEIKTTQNGSLMAKFQMATRQKDKTDWHAIVAWGEAAKISQLLRRGDPVFIEGSNQTRQLTDQDGIQRPVTEVVAWTIHPFKGREETLNELLPSEHGA